MINYKYVIAAWYLTPNSGFFNFQNFVFPKITIKLKT